MTRALTGQGAQVAAAQREILEEFARATGEDANHPLAKGFVDKLKEMFG